MKKHIILLITLTSIFIISFVFYKIIIHDYDFSKAKIVYKEEKKAEIFDYEFVNIFVPNKEFKKLEQKAVKIKRVDNKSEKIQLIFEELKRELNFKFYYYDDSQKKIEADYFDYGIRVQNSYFDGNDLYINLNNAFITNIKTKEQELMLIYSIVNTYTDFGDIKRIKILINNQVLENLKYYKISVFFERDLNI